jgi:mono/diheme cytochrome c family protein
MSTRWWFVLAAGAVVIGACVGDVYWDRPGQDMDVHDHDHDGHDHAEVPPPYAGLVNPFAGDHDAIEAGRPIYEEGCAGCHGEAGRGDGAGAARLDPAPADLTEHSAYAADDYWFWRISEGGAVPPYDSAMPAWKDSLSETEIWQVLTYCRHLAEGEPEPQHDAGGGAPDAGTGDRDAGRDAGFDASHDDHDHMH